MAKRRRPQGLHLALKWPREFTDVVPCQQRQQQRVEGGLDARLVMITQQNRPNGSNIEAMVRNRVPAEVTILITTGLTPE